MGCYSWCTEASSSSVGKLSNEEAEVSSHTRRPISFGIPSSCYCGLKTQMKMMDYTDEYPGRIFFGCKNYKQCPPHDHLVKWWDEAMMEEFQELRCAVDYQGLGIRDSEIGDREALKRTEAEIVQLKAKLMEIRRFRRVEVIKLCMGVAVVVCLIIYSVLG